MRPHTPRVGIFAGLLGLCLVSLAEAQYAQFPSMDFPTGTQLFYVDKYVGDNGNTGGVNDPWQDLGFAYTQMVAVMNEEAPESPSALIVAPGYYAPSTGEAFPIGMEPLRFIAGTDANTTIVALEGTGSVFNFLSMDPKNPRIFAREDGAYLQRLTIRNTGIFAPDLASGDPESPYLRIESWSALGFEVYPGSSIGIAMAAAQDEGTACFAVQPTLLQLVMYGFTRAISGEYVGPLVLDCTIVRNQNGLWAADDAGQANPCCAVFWEVANSVVNLNTEVDLQNLSEGNVSYSSWETWATSNCVGVVEPIRGAGSTNPDYTTDEVTTSFIYPPQLDVLGLASFPEFDLEFDLRLVANSVLRQLGAFAGMPSSTYPVLWDGEGFMNLREDLVPGTEICIGADQFNSLRFGPLRRLFVAPPVSTPAVVTLDLTRVGTYVFSSSAISEVDFVFTPLGTTEATVWAVPILALPNSPSDPGYLAAPWIANPFTPASGAGFVFQGLLGITNEVPLAPIQVANTTVEAVFTLDVVVTNLNLAAQMAFVEFLPGGDIRVTYSNGQSHRTL